MGVDEIKFENFFDVENFDSLAKEHWDDFGNKTPKFNKTVLSKGRVITARSAGVVVGYLLFVFNDSPFYEEKICTVGMYYLQRTHRKVGVGKRMFLLLEQLAKEAGCKQIVVSYNLKQPLESFYNGLGFSATHVALAKEI